MTPQSRSAARDSVALRVIMSKRLMGTKPLVRQGRQGLAVGGTVQPARDVIKSTPKIVDSFEFVSQS